MVLEGVVLLRVEANMGVAAAMAINILSPSNVLATTMADTLPSASPTIRLQGTMCRASARYIGLAM